MNAIRIQLRDSNTTCLCKDEVDAIKELQALALKKKAAVAFYIKPKQLFGESSNNNEKKQWVFWYWLRGETVC